MVSIIIPFQNEENTFIISRANQLLKLDWLTGATTLLAELPANPNGFERFNDAKCDPQGRLFIGTVLEGAGGVTPEGGSLYRVDVNSGQYSFTKVASGFTISNGMSWSNNGATKLYFNDSDGCKVYVFDYDIATGSLCKNNLTSEAYSYLFIFDSANN